jgi:predicted RNA-binding Zn-ribbon protein involved in translation (DUF1610 family)
MTKRSIHDSFDRILKAAGLTHICPECGGLTQVSPAVIVLPYGQDPPECPTCGLYLDKNGKPVGYRDQDGMVTVRVISLRDDYPADAAPLPKELQGES